MHFYICFYILEYFELFTIHIRWIVPLKKSYSKCFGLELNNNNNSGDIFSDVVDIDIR